MKCPPDRDRDRFSDFTLTLRDIHAVRDGGRVTAPQPGPRRLRPAVTGGQGTTVPEQTGLERPDRVAAGRFPPPISRCAHADKQL